MVPAKTDKHLPIKSSFTDFPDDGIIFDPEISQPPYDPTASHGTVNIVDEVKFLCFQILNQLVEFPEAFFSGVFDDTVQVRIVVQYITETQRGQQGQMRIWIRFSQLSVNRAGENQVSQGTETYD